MDDQNAPAQPPDDEAPERLQAEYFYALGRFMHSFSMLEVGVNDLITIHVADSISTDWAKLDLVKSIIGGLRFKPARDTLKRLPRVSRFDDETREEVDRIFKHVGEIHFLRDRLAHNAAGPVKVGDEWWFASSNQVNIREGEDLEVIRFTVEMLHNAADDLFRADALLRRNVDGLNRMLSRVARVTDPDYAARLREPPAPWLYKPSQLRRSRPKSPHSQSGPNRPPGSSQE